MPAPRGAVTVSPPRKQRKGKEVGCGNPGGLPARRARGEWQRQERAGHRPTGNVGVAQRGGGVKRSEFSFSKLVGVILEKSKGLDPPLLQDLCRVQGFGHALIAAQMESGEARVSSFVTGRRPHPWHLTE